MSYEGFIDESLEFFENARKRSMQRAEGEEKPSVIIQLNKEIEIFSKMQGFWKQEKRRRELDKQFSK